MRRAEDASRSSASAKIRFIFDSLTSNFSHIMATYDGCIIFRRFLEFINLGDAYWGSIFLRIFEQDWLLTRVTEF